MSWQVHIVCGVAVPTIYRGIEYRSRLEARWAAMFDLLDWRHTYEPLDGNGYIPDFLVEIPGEDDPILVEVKPAATSEEYRQPEEKAETGLSGHWKGPVLFLGVGPLPQCFLTAKFLNYPAAGALAVPSKGWCDDCARAYWDEGHEPSADYAELVGARCKHVGLRWRGEEAIWCRKDPGITLRCISVGQGEDPHWEFRRDDSLVPSDLIKEFWAIATNEAKWKRSRPDPPP